MADPIGSAPGIIVGVGVGAAAAAALEPAVEIPKQEAWAHNANRILDPATIARLVAQGGIPLDRDSYDTANRAGLSDDKLRALVYLSLTAPDVPEALALWRRQRITEKQVDHALAKAQIEQQYWPAIKELLHARVAPPTIALAVQRGILENVRNPDTGERLLTVTPDLSKVTVNSPAMVPLDVLAEAASWGWDFDRLAVDARIAGLPPAPGELMQLLNRGLINEDDFLLGVAEGDTRNEWGALLRHLRHRVLSGVEAAELHVRGWVDQQTMYDLGALDGWTPERMDLLYDLRGRPPSLRQAFIGVRRGGSYDGPTTDIPDYALKELHQSNIRPPWFNIEWAQRHTLPSAFVVRTLLQDGALDESEGETIFLHSGWPQDLAKLVATHYANKSGGTADPHVTKAEATLWNNAQRSYIAGESSAADLVEPFTLLGIGTTAQAEIVKLWDATAALTRKTLTATQWKKALKEGVENPATGQPYTRDEIIAELHDLGYSPADAAVFLDL